MSAVILLVLLGTAAVNANWKVSKNTDRFTYSVNLLLLSL